MIIAIDGPAGAGKSTVARAVAARFGFAYLDTGALYRATALLAAQADVAPELVAEQLEISLGDRVLVGGRDVTEAIRTPEVTQRTAEIAQMPAVRAALVLKQRELLHQGDWVAEGRDIGTVVAPDADVKIFLTADEAERARRRSAESGHDVDKVRAELRSRDERDQQRTHSPLVPAGDAVTLDTTGLDVDEVVARIEALTPGRHSDRPRLFGASPAQLDRTVGGR